MKKIIIIIGMLSMIIVIAGLFSDNVSAATWTDSPNSSPSAWMNQHSSQGCTIATWRRNNSEVTADYLINCPGAQTYKYCLYIDRSNGADSVTCWDSASMAERYNIWNQRIADDNSGGGDPSGDPSGDPGGSPGNDGDNTYIPGTVGFENVQSGDPDYQTEAARSRPSGDCPETMFFEFLCEPGNPNSASGLMALILGILNWALIGVGTVVTIFIVLGGVTYSTAAGSQERTKKGVEIIRNALLGLVLYLVMLAALNFLVPGGVFNSTL